MLPDVPDHIGTLFPKKKLRKDTLYVILKGYILGPAKPESYLESKSGKTRISAPAHLSATDGRVSGLVSQVGQKGLVDCRNLRDHGSAQRSKDLGSKS